MFVLSLSDPGTVLVSSVDRYLSSDFTLKFVAAVTLVLGFVVLRPPKKILLLLKRNLYRVVFNGDSRQCKLDPYVDGL